MLEIKNIRKSFKNKEVLKDVSFSVREGEIVCLLGNNGAGKTTIINCILRMIKLDSGTILLNGKDITKYKNTEYFSNVNALLESSVNIYDYLTGRQNIDYFAGLMNINKKLSVINTLNEIIKTEKISVILTTHQMDVVQKLNSRILILKDGIVSDFDKEKYEEKHLYSVSYIKNNLVEQAIIEGTFNEIYDNYCNEYEIVEIKKKERDIEEIMVEVLNETH